MYLYEVLLEKIPIIGVAKKAFKDNEKLVRKILRGESKKPLYVSSVDIDVDLAANYIQNMAGEYRIPNLLKILDQRTKI
ncbi:MAG: hypothetical protein AAFP82_17595 [Bacteroidota bacterium]